MRTLAGLERLWVGRSQGSRKLELWAEISERLRRNFKLNHYRKTARRDLRGLRLESM